MKAKQIDHEQIKSVSLIKEMPNYKVKKMKDISQDGTGAIVDDCTDSIKWCSENMERAIAQMNTYIDAIADEFEEMDKRTASGISAEAGSPFEDLVSQAVGGSSADKKAASPNPFASKI